MNLTVHKLGDDEVYQDFARIPTRHRKSHRGRLLQAGLVCSLFCTETGRKAYIILRNSGYDDARICIDYRTRQRLRVKPGETYDFDLKPAGIVGQVIWARKASDVRYRIPVNIALLAGGAGLLLGLISVFLGIVALVKTR